MELEFWLTREEARVEETKRVITREENELLLVREKLRTNHLVTKKHKLISQYPRLERPT